jgi:hypothetical protein
MISGKKQALGTEVYGVESSGVQQTSLKPIVHIVTKIWKLLVSTSIGKESKTYCVNTTGNFRWLVYKYVEENNSHQMQLDFPKSWATTWIAFRR